MSDFHFGVDDYDLNYYPKEASDGMCGVDWDKVERVEIEYDLYVKERTCRNISDDPCWFECSECRCTCSIDYWGDGLGLPRFCPSCGKRVSA